MESDIELTLNEQENLLKMLKSNDLETKHMALNIISTYPPPKVVFAWITKSGTTINFIQFIQKTSIKVVSLIKHNHWIYKPSEFDFAKNNIDLFKTLSNYGQ